MSIIYYSLVKFGEILFVDKYCFGYSGIILYKENMKKVSKKKVLWENMAVLIFSHQLIIFYFCGMYKCVIKCSFGISGSSGADREQGLWTLRDEVHEGNLP